MPTQEEINKAINDGNKQREKIRLEHTKSPFGNFDTKRDRLEFFKNILLEYHIYNITWGSLHIYLEDGNSKINDVEYCLKHARDNRDWIGVYLCQELLYFGERFIKNVCNTDVINAVNREIEIIEGRD